jgi:hypothetical protein
MNFGVSVTHTHIHKRERERDRERERERDDIFSTKFVHFLRRKFVFLYHKIEKIKTLYKPYTHCQRVFKKKIPNVNLIFF